MPWESPWSVSSSDEFIEILFNLTDTFSSLILHVFYLFIYLFPHNSTLELKNVSSWKDFLIREKCINKIDGAINDTNTKYKFSIKLTQNCLCPPINPSWVVKPDFLRKICPSWLFVVRFLEFSPSAGAR